MMTKAVDPRIERTREVVLRAAVEVVGDQGFSGASIDAIAQRSCVARSTIYRHWAQRMDLLLEAASVELGRFEELAVGELRSDLIAISTHLVELLSSEPVGSVTASMILESRHDPALDELRKQFVEQRRHKAIKIIGDAINRGELPAGTNAGVMANDLAAQIFFQTLVLQVPVDPEWVEKHVDSWLNRYGARRASEGASNVD